MLHLLANILIGPLALDLCSVSDVYPPCTLRKLIYHYNIFSLGPITAINSIQPRLSHSLSSCNHKGGLLGNRAKGGAKPMATIINHEQDKTSD